MAGLWLAARLLRAGEAEQDVGLACEQILAKGKLRDAAVLQHRPPRVAPRRLQQHRRVIFLAAAAWGFMTSQILSTVPIDMVRCRT